MQNLDYGQLESIQARLPQLDIQKMQKYYEEFAQAMQLAALEIQKQNSIIHKNCYMTIATLGVFLAVMSRLFGIGIRKDKGSLPQFYRYKPEFTKNIQNLYAFTLYMAGLSFIYLYNQFVTANVVKGKQTILANEYEARGETFGKIIGDIITQADAYSAQAHQDFYPRLQL